MKNKPLLTLIVILLIGIPLVLAAPSITSLIAEPLQGVAPLTVQFNVEATNADTYVWDFKDETTSTEEDPEHVFEAVGTYNVDVTVTETTTGETAILNQTVRALARPTIQTLEANPNSAVQGAVIVFTFTASSTEGTITQYELNSSLDGNIYLGAEATATSTSLTVGEHVVQLRAQDELGTWSEPSSVAVTIIAPFALSTLGTTLQVIPRFSSLNGSVHAYNASKTQYLPCLASKSGSLVMSCTDSRVTRNTCSNALAFEYPGSAFKQSGEHLIEFGGGQAAGGVYEPVQVGPISVVISYDTGIRFLSVETGTDIPTASGGWVQAQLYEVSDCTIAPVGELVPLTWFAVKNYFTYLPEFTCRKETCTYQLEILARDEENNQGGKVYKFTATGSPDEIEPDALTVSSDKTTYGQGSNARLIANASGLTNVSAVTFQVVTPAAEAVNGVLVYSNNKKVYEGTLKLGVSGQYVINITTVSNEGTQTKQLGLTVNNPIAITASSTAVALGTVQRGEPATQQVTLTNTGDADITGLRVEYDTIQLGLALETAFTQSTLPAGGNVTLTFRVDAATSGTANGTYAGTATIKGNGMTDIAVQVSYTLTIDVTEQPLEKEKAPSLVGLATPAGWNAGSLTAGGTTTQTFTLSTSTGETVGIEAQISMSSALAQWITLDVQQINLEIDVSEIGATLVAPQAAGTYSGEITIIFTQNDDALNTKIIPVEFSVVDSVQDSLTAAQARLTKVKRGLETLEAQAGAGSKIAKKLQGNITEAKQLFANAKQKLADADTAIAEGQRTYAEDLIHTADSDLVKADQIVRSVTALLTAGQADTKKSMVPIAGTGGFLGIFFLGILGLREGWIPAHKFPGIVKLFEKIGLGSLVEKPTEVVPKDRYTGMVPRAEAVTPVTPQDEAAREKWAEYAKRNPAYAQYNQQQYRSFYHRRYQ